MVAIPKKTWLSSVRVRLGGSTTPYDPTNCDRDSLDSPHVLGILAFEAGRAMSRLVSLHRSLSDPSISTLRSSTLRSDGVGYLVSLDQRFLLRLACAEMVDDLDRAADAISRIAGRGGNAFHRGFHHVYADLKAGNPTPGLGFHPKEVEKKMRKMEKLVGSTARLHAEMETLSEMEASERKLHKWKNYSGPMTPNPPGADILLRNLALQRRLVSSIQDDSLWRGTYDKVSDLMAKAAITVFAKICSIFSGIVPELPVVVVADKDGRFRFAPGFHQFRVVHPSHASGPLERQPGTSGGWHGNSGPILRPGGPYSRNQWAGVALQPGPDTVGGSGLALRYADVIDMADRMLFSPGENDSREELYEMLPASLRAAVKTKLYKCWKMESGAPAGDDTLADGWRDAAGQMLKWLSPMAQDTIKWQSVRSCDNQKFHTSPKLLVVQTLFFADREKTEAAIVELLVGLSCVCRYQHNNNYA